VSGVAVERHFGCVSGPYSRIFFLEAGCNNWTNAPVPMILSIRPFTKHQSPKVNAKYVKAYKALPQLSQRSRITRKSPSYFLSVTIFGQLLDGKVPKKQMQM